MSGETELLRTDLRAALDRISLLEGQVAELSGRSGGGRRAATVTAETTPTPPQAATLLDRRRLLARGGTAAVGALLGGTAATIAAASPAAAATGSFDSSTSTPALTVTSTGTGPTTIYAMEVTATGAGSTGAFVTAEGVGVAANGDWGVRGQGTSFGLVGSGPVGVVGQGSGYGGAFAGADAQLRLGQVDFINPLPPPRTRSDAHNNGEIYLDGDLNLWLCTEDGTPGIWTRIGGAGTTGALTMLATPARVYDTRDGSGRPGAGTGPVTGVRHDIDLTANSSGLPVDATAALVTLTVTDTVANPAAYGQIFANALVTPPTTSTINWTAANSIVATTTTTALTAGKVAISMNPGANVLVDVLGYYR